jgi:hypothetical protein
MQGDNNMSPNELLAQLRADCKQVIDRPAAAAPSERFWEFSEVLKLVVEHLILAGTAEFLSHVAADLFMNWWRGEKTRIESSLPPAGQDLSPNQLKATNEAVREAIPRILEELGRLNATPDPKHFRTLQQEIERVLLRYNFEETLAAQIAGELAPSMANKIAAALPNVQTENHPPSGNPRTDK